MGWGCMRCGVGEVYEMWGGGGGGVGVYEMWGGGV